MHDQADDLAAALDARHADAQVALNKRDVGAYSDLFSHDLRYWRRDGRVIGKSELIRDLKAQFRRMSGATSRFTRNGLVIDGETVTEILAQSAVFEASAFGIVQRTWSIERRGRYVWKIESGLWRIIAVHVEDEQVRSKWRLSFWRQFER